MTDIVERLNVYADEDRFGARMRQHFKEAADEIERLRGEAEQADEFFLLERQAVKLKTKEIERLKSERDRWYDAAERRLEELGQLRVKNPAPSTE